MPPDINHEELKKLMVENQRMLIENNQLLHKMRRGSVISSFFRVVWFLIVVSLPIYAYFSYIQPNMEVIKLKVDSFEKAASESGFFKNVNGSMNNKDAI